VHAIHRADPAADSEWHKALIRRALDDIYHGRPPVRAGGDVEENHLIRALLIIAQRQLDGIAYVAQFARLGFTELDAARHLAVMHVQAGDDSFREHINLPKFYTTGMCLAMIAGNVKFKRTHCRTAAVPAAAATTFGRARD